MIGGGHPERHMTRHAIQAWSRSLSALVLMDLRRIVRTRWTVPLLLMLPLVVLPLTELVTVTLTRPTPASTVAIPLNLPESFALAPALRAGRMTPVPVADPGKALAEGVVDAAVFEVQPAGDGTWSVSIAGAGTGDVSRAVQRAGDAALTREVAARGGDGWASALPDVTRPASAADDPLTVFPRGLLSGWLALVPLGILFYALLPLAAADRASGVYETLLALPVPPSRAVVARLLAVLVISLAATGLYTGTGLALIGLLTRSALPALLDVVRVAVAQAVMVSALIWAGERSSTSAQAMQLGGLILYGVLGLVTAALVSGAAWIPLGGVLVAEGGNGVGLGTVTSSLVVVGFLWQAARARAVPT